MEFLAGNGLKILSQNMSRLTRMLASNHWFAGVFIVVLVTFITVSMGRNVSLLELTENYLADVRMALMSAPRPQSERIAVVLINDTTLAQYPYRSPLDRSLIAGLLEELEGRGATAIGINVLFDRPTEPHKDALLYQRLRSARIPVVLSKLSSSTGFSLAQVEFSNYFLEDLRAGLSYIYRDTVDNTIRVSMLKLIQGRTVHLGFSATLAEVLGIEIPDQEKLHIDFRPGPDLYTGAFPTYLAHELGAVPAAAFANRIVLVGSDLGDDSGRRTPLSLLGGGAERNMPGVVIEAHVLSQLIENRSLQHVSFWSYLLVTSLMASIGCLLSLVVSRLWLKSLMSILLIPLSWTAAFIIFLYLSYMLPMVAPTLAFMLALVISSFWQWRSEFLRRERIHHTFGQYLSPAVVESILLNPDDLELSGEVREVTFLFTDLEGFTLLTESTEPKQMVRLLNAYLEEACDIVIEHGGTIDKIVGDALHVMFNAPLLQPDHAQRAVECALALDAWSLDFRERMQTQGISLGVTRIGVNTGDCIVGNFGGKKRFDYTAHGDVVNTTARLESINKRLGTTICVSESTVEQCQAIRFRPIANLVLAGKTQGIVAYLPMPDQDYDPEMATDYELAYQSLCDNDPTAVNLFAELAERYPEDTLVQLHLKRTQSDEISETLVFRRK